MLPLPLCFRQQPSTGASAAVGAGMMIRLAGRTRYAAVIITPQIGRHDA
jgi:hypothetical protein